jgi:hypothetical protein
VGLGGQELPPGRTRLPRCGTDPASMQDLPHRGGGDRVAELDELAVNAPMPHVGFSVAMRIMNLRIAGGVDGEPGRRGLV